MNVRKRRKRKIERRKELPVERPAPRSERSFVMAATDDAFREREDSQRLALLNPVRACHSAVCSSARIIRALSESPLAKAWSMLFSSLSLRQHKVTDDLQWCSPHDSHTSVMITIIKTKVKATEFHA